MALGSEFRTLWLSRNTTIEMIKDRKYTTTQSTLSLDEFTGKYPSALTKRSTLNFVSVNIDRPVAVHFGDDERMGKKVFEMLLDQYERENIFHIIFVVPQMPSPAVMSMTQSIEKFDIEFFSMEELRFNKTRHTWVPVHRILSKDEKENVLGGLKLEPSDLPKILKSDVIARYLGAKQGEVIEIIRKSKTAGESMYYRIVVDRQK